MNKDITKEVQRIAQWAKTMTKWFISRKNKGGAIWQIVNFVGPKKSESRGIVDLLAIRKDHKKQNTKIKRGDLFEIVLIQVKGGSAQLPTPKDIKRLKAVAKYHRAKAIVLSEWKLKKSLQLYLFKQNRWIEIEPNKIF